ncbi:hypothetical protein RUMGNA_01247 [Mediterraneibacter gnavus ATCC 29149]|uniref:Uncharacterized protein n=1 Tax=Mediterraneibacter gnavus (strain ATCC 29149 / DSM 114966 / JCM 6515 / VPI C7-9) TaxID=411470 RepID=A7B121_MEDG7|nr:hypothetical protein RUMGNA_01247 [Mediterraneibacter gnavus ATCC 29149]
MRLFAGKLRVLFTDMDHWPHTSDMGMVCAMRSCRN